MDASLATVYRHDGFWVVHKPAGMSVQESHHGPGVLATLKAREGGEFYPVHRLDAGTSGLLIVARTPAANSALSQAFQAKAVEKFYIALSARKPDKKQGSVIGDMEKSRRGAWMLLHGRDNQAITRFFSKGLGGIPLGGMSAVAASPAALRLFLVKPETGKTHQIRVALKSVGAPILGDELYGGAPADRMYLHAYALRFRFDGEDYAFTCMPDTGVAFAGLAEQEGVAEFLAEPWSKAWPGRKPANP